LNKENKVKQACPDEDKAVQERRERIEKVAQLLSGVHYKTETEKAEAIISFSKSKMELSEIEFIANTLRPDYR
jgi:uncharacterized protein YeeX (DUF496 family)